MRSLCNSMHTNFSENGGITRGALLPLFLMLIVGITAFTGSSLVVVMLFIVLTAYVAIRSPAMLLASARFLLVFAGVFVATGSFFQVLVGVFSPEHLLLGVLRLTVLTLGGLAAYSMMDTVAFVRLLSRVSPGVALTYLAALRLVSLALCLSGDIWGVIRVNGYKPGGLRERLGLLTTGLRALAHNLLDQSLLLAEAQYLQGRYILSRTVKGRGNG